MYRLFSTSKFKKDLKNLKINRKDFESAIKVLKILETDGVEAIPLNIKPLKLIGNYKDNWECHIKPDLLIIWIQIEVPDVIKLIRIGSHSDLFK